MKLPEFRLYVTWMSFHSKFCDDNWSSVMIDGITVKSTSSPEFTHVPICKVQFWRSNGHRAYFGRHLATCEHGGMHETREQTNLVNVNYLTINIIQIPKPVDWITQLASRQNASWDDDISLKMSNSFVKCKILNTNVEIWLQITCYKVPNLVAKLFYSIVL